VTIFCAYLATFSRSHFWGIFAGLGLLLGYLASSGAKSDVVFLLSDALSYKGDKISRVSRIIFEIHILGYLGLLLGYLASSGAKSDVIFLLGDPNFLKGDEILHVSRIVFEIPIWGYLRICGSFWGI